MYLLKKFFVGLVFVGFLFFYGQNFVFAQGTSADGLPVNYDGTIFGGIITYAIPCPCSFNSLIYVSDLVSKSVKAIVVSPPFSKLYLFYTFNPGQWALGTFSTGPKCMVYSGTSCEEVYSDGAINSGPGAGSSGIFPLSWF